MKARARPIPPTRMNKTEAAYAQELELQGHRRIIRLYEFEPIKLRLAPNTFYTPDFMVISEAMGEVEFHEVKGFWRDDARVKIKVAAAQYPWFRFIAVQKGKRGEPVWKIEEIRP